MISVKIYIKLIDGTETWVLVQAQEITKDSYLILNSTIFDNLDNSELFEFYPGDIVELKNMDFSGGTLGETASRLIKAGNFPDRAFREFMFLIMINRIKVQKDALTQFKKEIIKIRTEKDIGHFIYPQVLRFLTQLENLK